jgi:hypothetical protein
MVGLRRGMEKSSSHEKYRSLQPLSPPCVLPGETVLYIQNILHLIVDVVVSFSFLSVMICW